MQRSENFIIALVLALLSSYWLKMSMTLPQTATTTLYGPRFFPQLILEGLFLCIVIFLWKGLRQLKNKYQTETLVKPKVLILLLIIVGYIFLFERVGFGIASIIYIIVAQLLFGIRNKLILFLISPCIIVALNVLFVVIFKIPVP